VRAWSIGFLTAEDVPEISDRWVSRTWRSIFPRPHARRLPGVVRAAVVELDMMDEA